MYLCWVMHTRRVVGHNYVWGAHWLLHQCPRTAWSWWPPRHQDYSVCPHNLRHHHRCPAQPHGRLRGRYSHGVAGMAEQGHSRRTAVSSATLRRVTNRPLAPSSPLGREYRDRSRRAAASVTECSGSAGQAQEVQGAPRGDRPWWVGTLLAESVGLITVHTLRVIQVTSCGPRVNYRGATPALAWGLCSEE